MTALVARVAELRRRRSSRNGNPSWEVVTDDGRVLRTGEDAQVGYEVTPGWVGRTFRFGLGQDGTVRSAEEVDPHPNS